MKTMFKTIAISALCAVLFTSCKREEDEGSNNPAGSGNLPTKIIQTYQDNPNQPIEYIYTYNGNKLSEINVTPKTDISKVKFTYSGENITKVETFIEPSFKIYTTQNFEYTNDKLTKATKTEPNGTSSVINYTHNADGTVTGVYVGQPNSSAVYTISNGNLTKRAILLNGNTIQTTNNIFDNKNNIYKNITGMSRILPESAHMVDGNTNNLLTTNGATNYSYEYNSSNYPTKVIYTGGVINSTSVITY